jgi:hypothetical protein
MDFNQDIIAAVDSLFNPSIVNPAFNPLVVVKSIMPVLSTVLSPGSSSSLAMPVISIVLPLGSSSSPPALRLPSMQTTSLHSSVALAFYSFL